jgi:hypothetical protein
MPLAFEPIRSDGSAIQNGDQRSRRPVPSHLAAFGDRHLQWIEFPEAAVIPCVPFDAVNSPARDMALIMAMATLAAYSVLVYGSMAVVWVAAHRPRKGYKQ